MIERQAIRRMQGGALTRDEVGRLSDAFEALDDRLDHLYAEFGLGTSPPALELAR